MFNICLSALLAGALALPAAAQSSPNAATAALELAEEGRAALEANDWLGAYDLYLAAWQIQADPAFAYNLGGISETVGRLPEALRWYQTYLDVAPEAPDAGDVQAAVDEIEAVLGRDWARLRVTSTPEGALVRAERAGSFSELGETPLDVWLEPGRVSLTLLRDGYAPLEQPVTLEAGVRSNWTGTLVPVEEDGDAEPIAEGTGTSVSSGAEAAPDAASEADLQRAVRARSDDRGDSGRAAVAVLSSGAAVGVGAGVAAYLAATAASDYRALIETVSPERDAELGVEGMADRRAELVTLRGRTQNAEIAAYALGAVAVGLVTTGAVLAARPRTDGDAVTTTHSTPRLGVGLGSFSVRW